MPAALIADLQRWGRKPAMPPRRAELAAPDHSSPNAQARAAAIGNQPELLQALDDVHAWVRTPGLCAIQSARPTWWVRPGR